MITDKKMIKKLFSQMGFVVEGNFLIGNLNEDVISGFALDFAPSMSTIWTFVLPTFDDLDFLHMSLGERVIYLDDDAGPLVGRIAKEWHRISEVLSASNLLEYLKRFDERNAYANWCKLLCFIRNGFFEGAGDQMDVVERNESAAISRKLGILKNAIAVAGWDGAQSVLNEWSSKTRRLVKREPLVIPSG